MADHSHGNVRFQTQITKKFKDALTRQVNEAVRIYSRPAFESLNSKSKFIHPPHARVVGEKKKYELNWLKVWHIKGIYSSKIACDLIGDISCSYRTGNSNQTRWPNSSE